MAIPPFSSFTISSDKSGQTSTPTSAIYFFNLIGLAPQEHSVRWSPSGDRKTWSLKSNTNLIFITYGELFPLDICSLFFGLWTISRMCPYVGLFIPDLRQWWAIQFWQMIFSWTSSLPLLTFLSSFCLLLLLTIISSALSFWNVVGTGECIL